MSASGSLQICFDLLFLRLKRLIDLLGMLWVGQALHFGVISYPCSSSEISLSFSRRFSISMPSRRTFLMATARLFGIFARDLRQFDASSSFSSGIGTRMMPPSCMWIEPESASRIALSTALRTVLVTGLAP